MSELSKVSNGGFIVEPRGLLRLIRRQKAEMNLFTSKVDIHAQFSRLRMERNSLKSGLVVLGDLLVSAIKNISAGSKILFSVVESIAIAMIYVFCAVRYISMHEDKCFGSRSGVFSTCCVDVPRLFRGYCAPVELVYAFVVFGVNYAFISTSKRNYFDRLIKRLDHSVSLHVAFHDSYSNRNCAVWPHVSILLEGGV